MMNLYIKYNLCMGFKKQNFEIVRARIINKIMLNLLKCSNKKFNRRKILIKIISKNFINYRLN